MIKFTVFGDLHFDEVSDGNKRVDELIEHRIIYTVLGILGAFYYKALIDERYVIEVAENVGSQMALAITNWGQILFLYHCGNREINFSEEWYSIYWEREDQPWRLVSGEDEFLFQLPQYVMETWLDNSVNELEMRKEAINCKGTFLSNMVVYYMRYGIPTIRMISINKDELENARQRIKE